MGFEIRAQTCTVDRMSISNPPTKADWELGDTIAVTMDGDGDGSDADVTEATVDGDGSRR